MEVHVRNEIRATGWHVLWTFAWMATLALAKFGPRVLWEPSLRWASWGAVAVNLAVGVGWIVVFTRFLRAVDELQRKIMQDALAVTLGVGWVVGFAYVVADGAGLVDRDVDIAALPVLMGAVFVIAFFVGKVRYR
jgi:hypothetical protein